MNLSAILSLVLAASTAGGLTVLAATDAQPVVDQSAQTTATTSILGVIAAAHQEQLLTGESDEAALANTVATTSSNGALTSSGLTVTWQASGYCFDATVSSLDAPASVQSCPSQQP